MLYEMLKKKETVSNVFEQIKTQMCDHYCKYPATYKVDESDQNWEDMTDTICKDCPLNAL